MVSFYLSWTRASAEFLRAEFGLRSGSACRVESLSRPHVTLARFPGQYSIVVTPRGPGTLYVLSIPYRLLGDKEVRSAERMDRLYKSAGGFSAQKPNVYHLDGLKKINW